MNNNHLLRRRIVNLSVLAVLIVICLIAMPVSSVAATNDGRLHINASAIEQQGQSKKDASTVTKANEEIPDLFDPAYAKGLSRVSKAAEVKQAKERKAIFASSRVNSNDKMSQRAVTKVIFTSKVANTKSDTVAEGSNGLTDRTGLIVITVVVAIVAIVLGVFIGIKGQRWLFGKHHIQKAGRTIG